jgi:hypothetical protein
LRGELRRRRAGGLVGRRQVLDALREAEVHHLHVPVRGQHDVGGLQIAMEEPALVRFLQRFGDLAGQSQGLGQPERAVLQAPVERVAGDVLHDQEDRVALFADLEDLADVRMIERGHRHRFAPQPLPRLHVGGGGGWEQLDRDLTIETGVVGAIDLAHAALTDLGDEAVAAETSAGRERWLQAGGV